LLLFDVDYKRRGGGEKTIEMTRIFNASAKGDDLSDFVGSGVSNLFVVFVGV
jgi:hypothetical protein